ncbi:MAG TPA: SDR family NAD(P)-dependent oxidoreductase, partial [Treponema sp.]|nr:SDR family NAD(P)-dependent oxidoreductase [Treponema sp.]
MDRIFSNRVALVIGGSGGIGKAVAIALAKEGAQICIHGGHSKDRLERTLREVQQTQTALGINLEQQHHKTLLLPITGADSVTLVLETVPKVDILVYAFGPFLQKDLAQMTAEDWNMLTTMNLALPG